MMSELFDMFLQKTPLVALFLIIFPLMSWAQQSALVPEAVILTDDQGQYPLGWHLEYLEDPRSTLTLEEVTSPEYADRFVLSQKERLRFGLTGSAYWVHVHVINMANLETKWWLEYAYPLVYHLDLYVSTTQKDTFLHTQAGRKYPFSHRVIPYETFVLPLSPEPQKDFNIYLRVESKLGLPIPLTLWSVEAFNRQSQTKRFWQGIQFGILAIMACYNGFLFLALREKPYGYYALFLFSLILSNLFMGGLSEQYLPPLAEQNMTSLFVLFAYMALLKFSSSFLQTISYFPRWNTGVHMLLIGWSVLAAVAFITRSQGQGFPEFMLYMVMLFLHIFLTYACIVILAVMTWRKGYRPARYFFTAILVNFLSPAILVFNMATESNLPDISKPFNIGRIFMILLFSLALTDRINVLKEDREHAYRHLQDYREHLEELVETRTRELYQTLDNLRHSQHDLEELNQHLEQRVHAEVETRQHQEQFLIQKSKLESLGSLAAGIAHEINQPLTRIGIGTESLLLKVIDQEPISPEYLEKRCRIIQDSMQRMTRIIDHIRTFSRDQQSLRTERIDVNAVIDNALAFIRTQYQHHNIVIDTDLQAGGCVLGNQYKLEQVILNLLSNARDAIEANTQTIEAAFQQGVITIRTYNGADGTLTIEIEDTGTGIPDEVIEEIFAPFFTTKDVGKGTGLGLSISYGIIKDMHGNMTVESQLGKGTLMKIILPRIV